VRRSVKPIAIPPWHIAAEIHQSADAPERNKPLRMVQTSGDLRCPASAPAAAPDWAQSSRPLHRVEWLCLQPRPLA